MSYAAEHLHGSDTLGDGLFDRLVDGGLSEKERCALLIRLDSEPDGWRRCAMAFLEAQLWREAFAPLGAANVDQPKPVAELQPARTSPSRRRISRWFALAASVAIAFMLGWTAKPVATPEIPAPHAEMVSAPTPIPASTEQPRTEANSPPVEQPTPEPAPEMNPLIKSIVAAGERRGYTAERQKTLVTVKFEDGSERKVQAEEVRLRYVAGRTY